MSDNNTIVVKSDTALVKRKTKPINYALTRILKQQKFSPLTQLIRDVYPDLKPKEKAKVLLEIMKYIYPTISPAELSPIKRKKGMTVNVNTQVNAGGKQDQSTAIAQTYSLQDLLAAASGVGKKDD